MRIVGVSTLISIALMGRAAVAEEATLPAPVIAAALRTAQCSEPANADSVIETTDLGGGQSLVQVRCWTAAYQSGSIFFVMRAGASDKARLLRFQEPSKGSFRFAFSLSEPDFDAATKIMRTLNKGRGVGDCGTMGEWRWTGADFRLTRYWVKLECDGEPFEDDAKWQVFPPKR